MAEKRETIEPIEKMIMDRANFFYITRCGKNGSCHLRTCIRDAIEDVTGLESPQFCSLFSTHKKDAEKYIDELYEKMKDLGAK
jgi:hypothetical protein